MAHGVAQYRLGFATLFGEWHPTERLKSGADQRFIVARRGRAEIFALPPLRGPPYRNRIAL